jgi:hypothetical protein
MIEFYSVESREIRISGFRPEFGFCHNINIRITVHPQEALLILGEHGTSTLPFQHLPPLRHVYQHGSTYMYN